LRAVLLSKLNIDSTPLYRGSDKNSTQSTHQDGTLQINGKNARMRIYQKDLGFVLFIWVKFNSLGIVGARPDRSIRMDKSSGQEFEAFQFATFNLPYFTELHHQWYPVVDGKRVKLLTLPLSLRPEPWLTGSAAMGLIVKVLGELRFRQTLLLQWRSTLSVLFCWIYLILNLLGLLITKLRNSMLSESPNGKFLKFSSWLLIIFLLLCATVLGFNFMA